MAHFKSKGKKSKGLSYAQDRRRHRKNENRNLDLRVFADKMLGRISRRGYGDGKVS